MFPREFDGDYNFTPCTSEGLCRPGALILNRVIDQSIHERQGCLEFLDRESQTVTRRVSIAANHQSVSASERT
jgi:hypothetical protein